MKKYDFNNFVGCVVQRRSAQTGTLYGVYHGKQSGLYVEAKWVTLCEKHSTLIGSDVLNLAKKLIENPMDWCEKCRQKYGS